MQQSIRLSPEVKAALGKSAVDDRRSQSTMTDVLLREVLVARGHLGPLETRVKAKPDD